MNAERPTRSVVDEDQPAHRREVLDHSAFGVISVTRSVCSPGVRLFGSDLRHGTVVNVTIERAREERHLSRSRHSTAGGMPLVSLSMSEAQWARFVASAGIGAGTPVTFSVAPEPSAAGRRVPAILVEESQAEIARREMEATAAKVIAGVAEAEAVLASLLEKPSVSKADVRRAMAALQQGSQHFAANAGFAQVQFERNVEKVVSDAKTEVEAFVSTVAVNTGLEALRNGAAPVLMVTSNSQPDAP